LFHSKGDLHWLKKIEIKYGCEGFEISNNFIYRNFSEFEMEFELKIKEASRVGISMKFDEIFSRNLKI
jgi:hypothetical protein